MGCVAYKPVDIGEDSTVDKPGENTISVRNDAFDSLMDIVLHQPDKPWENDSREAVRALVAKRYES